MIARHWEALAVASLLLVLLSIFFGKAALEGGKLLPADIAYTDPIYLGYAPIEFTKPHNILLYDQAYQFYPWHVYASEALKQGFLPFWNPYVYCGAPLMAADQPAVLYPLNILSYIFSPPDAVLFTALARLFVAGLATYWFVRGVGGDKFGALVSTITFTFSGFMIVWLGHPHTNVAAWLPALFLTAEWLHRRTGVQQVALVAVVIAAQLTGGHTETALYTLTAGGLYYLFQVVTSWWNDRNLRQAIIRLLSFAAAAALGFALASIHLLPFWEWLQQTAKLYLRTGVQSLRGTRFGPKQWLAGILCALLPNIFNNPTWPGEYKSFFPGWNFVEQTLYTGVISLSLAVVVSITRRREKQVCFWAALGFTALGVALRLPVFDWVNYLPLFSMAHYGRLRLIYTFCVAVLAGLGATDMLERIRKGSTVRAVIGLLAGFVALSIPVLLITPQILSTIYAQASAKQFGKLAQEVLPRAFSISNVMMYWPVLVALGGIAAFILCLRQVLSRKATQAVLLLLVIVDLFAFGMGYHTTIREELIFPETPVLQLLKSDKGIFRVVGTNIDLMPNTCMLHNLYDVRGLEYPSRRYLELCHAIGGRDWLGYGILFAEQLELQLLGLLNVKYVLTSSRFGPEELRYLRLLDEDKGIKVYQNLSCLPRSFIVHRVRVSEDSQGVLKALQDPEFDLASEIVLEKPPPPGFVETQDSPLQATAEITRYEPNRVTIQANISANGFLFLSDSYYPGWKAYVDDWETEIYQANYAFRAVYLTPGQHTVQFIYEPKPFRLASFISFTALLGVIALFVSPWLQRTNPARSLSEGGDTSGP